MPFQKSLISNIHPEFGVDFEHFVELQQSPLPLLVFYIWQILEVLMTIVFPYYDIFRAKSDDDHHGGIPVLACITFLILIPISLHLYHSLQNYLSPSSSSASDFTLNHKQPFRVYQIGNMFILFLVLNSAAVLLTVSSNDNECKLLFCLTMASKNSLQPYLVLKNVFNAIITPIIVKAHASWCVYLSFLISFFSSIISAIIVNESPQIYVALISFYVLGAIVVYDNELTLRLLYHNYMKHEENMVTKLNDNTDKQLLLLKEEELRYLFGNVAHDLKSPLHGFTLELETLSKHPVISEDHQFMESIVELSVICSFMLMTINRALDYSKASTGMLLVPSLEAVSVRDTLMWVLKCASPTQENPVKIEPLPESMSLYIHTDRYWFLENLLCLVSNAQKFTTEGPIVIRCLLEMDDPAAPAAAGHSPASSNKNSSENKDGLTITHSKNEGTVEDNGSPASSNPLPPQMMLRVEVEDSGKGIKPEDRMSLFQPFKFTQRQLGGTGLGLYSLSKRMEALGGRCGVTERRDGHQGSLFWFNFPYVADTEPVLMKPKERETLKSNEKNENAMNIGSLSIPSDQEEQVETKAPHLLNKHVLVVDDSVLIQKTTSRALTSEGYVVDIARNGLECLEMVKEHDYGFILMDIQMPVMDGIEATKRLREMENTHPFDFAAFDSMERGESSHFVSKASSSLRLNKKKKFVIIGISANSDHVTMQSALDAGMDTFLAKPLLITTLQKSLQDLTDVTRQDTNCN